MKTLRFFSLLLSLVILSSFAFPVETQALSGTKIIDAEYGDISLAVNGSPFTPYNAGGEPDEPFSVNGVVYVPIYSVADALNATVTWDAKKKTVSIDKHITAEIVIGKQETAATTKQLTVQYGNIKLKINGKRVTFKNSAKKAAEPFWIGETLYCPIRSAEPAKTESKAKLQNEKSLKKGMTNKEFQEAYTIAESIANKYAGMGKEDQLKGIYKDTRSMSETLLRYTDTDKHYNNVYGFFVLNAASCAGATRAVGLCLNILGIPYEHVNENKWSHQWCRVNLDGVYWICDAYGMYVGPEPSPYTHPLIG